MGKKTLQQRAGRGGQNFRSPSHTRVAESKYPPPTDSTYKGVVAELLHDPGRWVPLARIVLENGNEYYIPASEGMYVGQEVFIGPSTRKRGMHPPARQDT